MRARHVAAILACVLASALGAASCVAVLGADDDYINIVKEEICVCPQMQDLLGGEAECIKKIGDRLSRATPDTRAAWMKKYVDQCTSCPTVGVCYYTPPTCSVAKCDKDEECCGHKVEGGTTCNKDHLCVSQ